MSFATLRSLYALIGDALDDIERIYRDASLDSSPTPTTPYTDLTSPCTPYRRRRPPRTTDDDDDDDEDTEEDYPYSAARTPKTPRRTGNGASLDSDVTLNMLDFPPLDMAYYPTEDHDPAVDAAESLASHPDVIAATNRIVAACGQISATVHRPFLTLCDAAMGYHLPACLRFLEASHTVEILRAAGPNGMHVNEISRLVNVEEGKLSHILRLLATHHIMREVYPNVFANNRISAIMDSGKSHADLCSSADKYESTNGIAAFINLCTDELFKSSSYLADCYLPKLSKKSQNDTHAMHAPFNVAFDTDTPYFEWLERPGNEERLKRFGPAMTGTAAWQIPGEIVTGFPWQDLSDGSVVVDVGGGIGSTAMLLAHTFPHLRFVVQDRPQVAEHGLAAWRERCPEMLDTGRTIFLGHDFFLPQPPLLFPGSRAPATPSVFILRVVTHDWPDAFVTKILLNLRRAASPDTKLLIADYILAHACVDDNEDFSSKADYLPKRVGSLAPHGSPLLANLGKANANAYWLDLTMRVTFNAQERTLREMTTLALSAGWKIVDVAHGEGSLFHHLTAVPVDIPGDPLASSDTTATITDSRTRNADHDANGRGRSGSVLSQPESVRMDSTFGTQTSLPSADDIRKPTQKTRRPLLPWWRSKSVPDPRPTSKGNNNGGGGGKVTTPENQPPGDAGGGKPPKLRRPKLSLLTSPGPPPEARHARHTRSGSTVRILSPGMNKSMSFLPDVSPPANPAPPVPPPPPLLLLSQSQSTGSPLRTHARRTSVSASSRPTSSRSLGPGPGPGAGGLLPALEPAPPVKLRAMPSRTSLKKKASQVFEFSRQSVASFTSALGGGGGGGLGTLAGGAMGMSTSTTRLPLPGVEESPPPVPPLPKVLVPFPSDAEGAR